MTTRPRPRSARHTALGVIAALGGPALLLPLTGCGLVGGGDSVLLLGDSLTVLVADEVKADAGSKFDVEVSGTWGVRIDEEIDTASELASDGPDQVVINLGTNNLLQHHDTTASAEDLGALLDLFDDTGCVHIVNLNEHINRLGEDFGPDAAALNEKIRELAARRLNTHIIDWNKIVVDHAAEGIMSDDGVHPGPTGVTLLAKAYAEAIADC